MKQNIQVKHKNIFFISTGIICVLIYLYSGVRETFKFKFGAQKIPTIEIPKMSKANINKLPEIDGQSLSAKLLSGVKNITLDGTRVVLDGVSYKKIGDIDIKDIPKNVEISQTSYNIKASLKRISNGFSEADISSKIKSSDAKLEKMVMGDIFKKLDIKKGKKLTKSETANVKKLFDKKYKNNIDGLGSFKNTLKKTKIEAELSKYPKLNKIIGGIGIKTGIAGIGLLALLMYSIVKDKSPAEVMADIVNDGIDDVIGIGIGAIKGAGKLGETVVKEGAKLGKTASDSVLDVLLEPFKKLFGNIGQYVAIGVGIFLIIGFLFLIL